MNLDDLMAVWQSQDVSPLHGVDKTLLHLALRQDDAKLQEQRRRERWMIYLASAGCFGAMAFFLTLFIAARESKMVTGWDFLVAIAGVAAALLAGGVIYVSHKRQAQREQRFGGSLRDQLNRRITQLDGEAARARLTLVIVLLGLGGIGPIAILLLSWRINQKSITDDGGMLITLILVCFWSVATGIWEIRRQARELLPRKRRLEELLRELDA